MIKLNENQRKYLQRKLDGANERHAAEVAKIVEAAEKPGHLSYRLGWDTSTLMYNDLLRRELGRLVAWVDMGEEFKSTIEDVRDDYVREIMRWQPQHSTNPVSNVEDEMKHRARQEALEIVQQLEHD